MKSFPSPPTTFKQAIEKEVADQKAEVTDTEIMIRHLKPNHQKDPKVIKFIYAYIEYRDHKVAARKVGLHISDGRALLRRPDIAKTIYHISKQAFHKFQLDAEEIVESVKDVAFFDPIDLQRPDGTFVDNLSELDPSTRKAIKKMVVKNNYDIDENGIKTLNGKVITYEFWDKMKGLELLGNEKKIFKQTTVVEKDIGSNMRDLLLASKRRAEGEIDVTPENKARVLLDNPNKISFEDLK